MQLMRYTETSSGEKTHNIEKWFHWQTRGGTLDDFYIVLTCDLRINSKPHKTFWFWLKTIFYKSFWWSPDIKWGEQPISQRQSTLGLALSLPVASYPSFGSLFCTCHICLMCLVKKTFYKGTPWNKKKCTFGTSVGPVCLGHFEPRGLCTHSAVSSDAALLQTLWVFMRNKSHLKQKNLDCC